MSLLLLALAACGPGEIEPTPAERAAALKAGCTSVSEQSAEQDEGDVLTDVTTTEYDDSGLVEYTQWEEVQDGQLVVVQEIDQDFDDAGRRIAREVYTDMFFFTGLQLEEWGYGYEGRVDRYRVVVDPEAGEWDTACETSHQHTGWMQECDVFGQVQLTWVDLVWDGERQVGRTDDEGADGTADRISTSVWTDAEAELTRVEDVDSDGDGEVDSRTTQTWDDQQQLIYRLVENVQDGTTQSEMHTTWRDDGQPQSEVGQLFRRGELAADVTVTHTYGADDRLAESFTDYTPHTDSRRYRDDLTETYSWTCP